MEQQSTLLARHESNATIGLDFKYKNNAVGSSEQNIGIYLSNREGHNQYRVYSFFDILQQNSPSPNHSQWGVGVDAHLHNGMFVNYNLYRPLNKQSTFIHVGSEDVFTVHTETTVPGYDFLLSRKISVKEGTSMNMSAGYHSFKLGNQNVMSGMKLGLGYSRRLSGKASSSIDLNLRQVADGKWQTGLSYRIQEVGKSQGLSQPIIRDVDIVTLKNEKKFKFIHMTKTGGKAFNNLISRYPSSNLEPTFNHFTTAIMVQDLGYEAVAIVREPIERFLSAYHHWQNGSELEPNRKFDESIPVKDVNDFINRLRSDDPIAWSIFTKRHAYSKFAQETHFRKQSWWLDGDAKKTHLIIYDSQNLAANAQMFFRRVGINRIDASTLSVINKTSESKVRPTNTINDISAENLKWLKSYYNDDLSIYKKAVSKTVR